MNKEEYELLNDRKLNADRLLSEIAHCEQDLRDLKENKNNELGQAICAMGTRLRSVREAQLKEILSVAIAEIKERLQKEFEAL